MFYYDTKRSVEENLKVYQKYLEGFLKNRSVQQISYKNLSEAYS